MRLFSTQYRLLILVTLILVSGFLATSLASYVASRDAIEQSISEQTLPLTGDNIYSEIQKDILRPVFISSLMAHDTFVRDWMLGGEKKQAQIVRYLSEVKLKYGTVSSFLVSDRSHAYYYPGGVLKTVRQGVPSDRWFFRVRALGTADYETNVDGDMANRGSMTIFINHRVLDYQGHFIGATGVGLTLDTMSNIIDRYQTRFRRNIYFADGRGNIILAGKSMRGTRGSILALPGVRSIAGAILNHDSRPTRLAYRTGQASMLVNSRFIPELGWYLVVEQNVSAEVRPIQRVFALNLAISFAVTLLVLAITLLTVNRFQRRLERLASTDPLTGLLNRKALEPLLRHRIQLGKRHARPLAAVLFDIDFFKLVNDTHGHLWGDTVIRGVADLTRGVVRDSDVATRWGGEEYLLLLGDCDLEQAGRIAEALRRAVAAHDFAMPAPNLRVTISLGVAEYRHDEAESAFFSRADSALYRAKHGGRDRVELARA